MTEAEYADEAGDVVSIYQCPDCGEDLRVEFRENVPAHMIGLACPNGCIGLPVRIRDAARLDETFETRQPWRCYECREEIHVDDPPETENGWPLHPGECDESYRDDIRRLRAVGGEPHE
jgi:hypothetical protein